ncbi:TonB-dependent receptor [Dysgonomonas sp. Marseille-P4677]|uniref:TonB-dependent receptor n=1 Tax=Dysgonomonas sp. Marseille-P4677 TaxID=2364790 RepID=UPI0019117295|nr:TonB-dependent receptor [Dysgonomonas sp. Marseille-P4677]MBK5721882.1 TonB-dependent receptor [Dysgonomonas sp. Marseille-P4677]
MKTYSIIFLLLIVSVGIFAQQKHSIKGSVIDKGDRLPVSYASVIIKGTTIGTQTDSTGYFSISNLNPGAYTLQVSFIGYKTEITPEYLLTVNDLYVNIELEESINEVAAVNVYPSPFRRTTESPVGLHIISSQEIEKSPGANRDISRIVQSYPGVSFSPSGYRNDLVVRGGGPAENSFYIEGIEIPNINHFSTQGASGGPMSIINADFIREVNFYTAAFPSYSSDALSSVLDFKLSDGNPEKLSFKATMGASEASVALNGPLGKKTTYLVSVRRSYLEFLFDMIGLPFLPTYNDALFKIKTRFSPVHELTFIGLGGLDDMKLNDRATSDDAEYILGYLPTIKQETFTLGAVYKHYSKINTQTLVLSHSYLNNRNVKYQDNDESDPDNLRLKYKSLEQESKFRFENLARLGNWKINAGLNLDYVQYDNKSFQLLYLEGKDVNWNYDTKLDFAKWGVFSNIDYISSNEKFKASLGLRADAASYSSSTNKIYQQVSPRLSLSYNLINNLNASVNVGRYFQLPPLTALGFKNNDGVYVNKDLEYMRVEQLSGGFNFTLRKNIEISLEGFYKHYDKMPLSIEDGIPLMSKGDDYGVIGNEYLISKSKGKSYGVELLARWLVMRKVNVSSSFTLFKSQFDKLDGESVASAWDNGFIFNLTGTYYLPRNWSIGAKIKSIGGAPYTPYDTDKSSFVVAWNALGKPYFDYKQYNAKRSFSYTQLDIRADKTFYIKNFMIGLYVDLQNITGSSFKNQDVVLSTGNIINPEAPIEEQRYEMKTLKRTSSTIVPTIGVTFEF